MLTTYWQLCSFHRIIGCIEWPEKRWNKEANLQIKNPLKHINWDLHFYSTIGNTLSFEEKRKENLRNEKCCYSDSSSREY